jgi:hypothetical protein
MPTPVFVPIVEEQKYCSECGKVILRRAEICPNCGCRQTIAPNHLQFPWEKIRASIPPELQSPFVVRMLIMGGLNFFWPGLGNLVVGDKRGWRYMLASIVICLVGFFTLWIPVVLFFVYCTHAGYQFLTNAEASAFGHPSAGV